VVDVLDEKLQRNWVDDVFDEGVVFEVQKDGFVVVGAVIVGSYLGHWCDQHLDHINVVVFLEESHLDLVQPKSRMLRGVHALLDDNRCVVGFVLGMPHWLNQIE